MSKKELPNELKEAFRSKPYDIYTITKWLRKHSHFDSVSYQGYDVYGLHKKQKIETMLRGKDLIKLVINLKKK